MKVWHRRCRPVEGEVDERAVEPCTVESTASVNASGDNSFVRIAQAVRKFLKHPCRRFHRKASHGRTTGGTLELNDQSLLNASSNSAPAIAHLVESPETKNSGDARTVTPDVRPLTVHPTVDSETENVGLTAVTQVKWPKLKNAVLFAKAIPDEGVLVRVDVKIEKVEQSVVTIDPVVGRFSKQYHCQLPYRKMKITWAATDDLELYRRLLPVVTVNCWPLPIVFQKTIQPTTTETIVAAAATNILKTPLAIEWKPLAIRDKAEDQVDDEIETAVITYQVKGRFSYHNQYQRSYRKVRITRMTAGNLELYKQLLLAITVDYWPLSIVFQKTIQPTTTNTTVAAAVTNILKAPMAIEWITATPPAITTAPPVTTAASPTITAAPTANPNRRLCNRPNCKNRRCRRRQIAAAKAANSNGC
uniref:Uncharacterized protein n=1 Tax=Sipha flava TaxID=143950 RepID=A0A2S2QBT5_9HEMI